LEEEKLNEAVDLYARACEMLCPIDTPKEMLGKTPPLTLETFRAYFRCMLLQKGPDESLIPLCNRMIDIFEAYGTESSMCKMMLTLTLLELYTGDVVRAENTYLNTHLNNPIYARSKECELADLYVMAFKRQDITKLDEAQQHVQINYLDKEVQALAKKLSLFRTKQGYVVEEETQYNQEADQLTKEMAALMKDTGVDADAPVADADIDEFAGEGDADAEEDEIDLS
jgi:hypothetical protein